MQTFLVSESKRHGCPNVSVFCKNDLVTFQNKIIDQLKSLIQPEKEFATEGELISLFAFNKSTLAKMRMNNEIPYYKFGGKLFYKILEVNKLIAKNQIG